MTIMVYGTIKAGAMPEEYQKKGAEEEGERSKRAGALIGEVVRSIRTVASFNAEQHFLSRYSADVLADASAAMRDIPAACIFLGAGVGSMMVMIGGIYWYGFWLIQIGAVSAPGSDDPLCAVDYSEALNRVFIPMIILMFSTFSMIANSAVATDAAAAAAAAKELFDRIDRVSLRDPFDESGRVLTTVAGEVQLRKVSFAYPTRPDFYICSGYSLTVPAGTSCALVGPSGSGKSTIIALLERFYDPMSGTVMLDGVDIKSLNLRWLRSKIGLVAQEPVLFEGSVVENIRYGKREASEPEVEEAARLANAHDFITTNLSDGYDTQVGLRGGKLSGGQKQRVAIARAMIKKPPLLLLDEATSALDNASEKVVQAALDELLKQRGRTTVTIAHRLSTIRDSAKIAVINKGRVAEEGTHAELLANEGGLYLDLIKAQL